MNGDNVGPAIHRQLVRLMCCTSFALLLILSSFSEAQQPMPRIGYLSVLSPGSDRTRSEAFRKGLRELGYVDGQNIGIEARYAEGDLKRLPALASELVSLKPDVIVAGGSTAIGAMKKATKTIPIVMAHGSDPVELGYVASLAKPGSNITGLTHMAPELGGKRLELLKGIVPKLSGVAILTDPGTGGHGPQITELEPAGPALNLQLRAFEVRDPASLESAFYSFLQGLRELGYFEGKNIIVERRYAAGRYEQVPSLAAELIRLKVDVILAASTPVADSVKKTTNSIPIVMVVAIRLVRGLLLA